MILICQTSDEQTMNLLLAHMMSIRTESHLVCASEGNFPADRSKNSCLTHHLSLHPHTHRIHHSFTSKKMTDIQNEFLDNMDAQLKAKAAASIVNGM